MATTGMPWFRVNAGWEDHPKVQDLCDALGQPLAALYVERLWDWTARFYPEGQITASGARLEGALRWTGPKGKLVDALLRFRLLDGSEGAFEPHDWDEHNGGAYRKWDADRKKRKPKPEENPRETLTGSERVSEENPAETLRKPEENPAARNGTVRNEEEKEKITTTSKPDRRGAPQERVSVVSQTQPQGPLKAAGPMAELVQKTMQRLRTQEPEPDPAQSGPPPGGWLGCPANSQEREGAKKRAYEILNAQIADNRWKPYTIAAGDAIGAALRSHPLNAEPDPYTALIETIPLGIRENPIFADGKGNRQLHIILRETNLNHILDSARARAKGIDPNALPGRKAPRASVPFKESHHAPPPAESVIVKEPPPTTLEQRRAILASVKPKAME